MHSAKRPRPIPTDLRLGGQTPFRMRCANDSEIAIQLVLHKLIKVIFMIVTQEHKINWWELMEIYCKIVKELGTHAGDEREVVGSVQEVRVREDPQALPFDDGRRVADEVHARVVSCGFSAG